MRWDTGHTGCSVSQSSTWLEGAPADLAGVCSPLHTPARRGSTSLSAAVLPGRPLLTPPTPAEAKWDHGFSTQPYQRGLSLPDFVKVSDDTEFQAISMAAFPCITCKVLNSVLCFS